MRRQRARTTALLAIGGTLFLYAGRYPSAEAFDWNHDGQVDIWEYRDESTGALAEVIEDTNNDGRPDRFSYVLNGALRRESDTNFDGKVDESDQFDPDGNATRTVRDTDFDGVADVLVLYRDGITVYSQRVGPHQFAASRGSQHGSSLLDPFDQEPTVRQVRGSVGPLAGLASRAKPYTLPLHASFAVFPYLSEGGHDSYAQLIVRPASAFPRGPPASDSTL